MEIIDDLSVYIIAVKVAPYVTIVGHCPRADS